MRSLGPFLPIPQGSILPAAKRWILVKTPSFNVNIAASRSIPAKAGA